MTSSVMIVSLCLWKRISSIGLSHTTPHSTNNSQANPDLASAFNLRGIFPHRRSNLKIPTVSDSDLDSELAHLHKNQPGSSIRANTQSKSIPTPAISTHPFSPLPTLLSSPLLTKPFQHLIPHPPPPPKPTIFLQSLTSPQNNNVPVPTHSLPIHEQQHHHGILAVLLLLRAERRAIPLCFLRAEEMRALRIGMKRRYERCVSARRDVFSAEGYY